MSLSRLSHHHSFWEDDCLASGPAWRKQVRKQVALAPGSIQVYLLFWLTWAALWLFLLSSKGSG
jgi:hypothetical protein